ncbi:MAG: hypothetical protein ACRCX2_15030 [Paraclostridium sp.]
MPNDILKIARCTEVQVENFISTLNDYTILLATDTNNLYTKVNGKKVLLNSKETQVIYSDSPFQKDIGFYASNPDNIVVSIGGWVGICGTSTGEFKLCDPLKYKGELLGTLDRYDSTNKKYVVNLICNLYTDTQSKIGDIVYIGKDGTNIISSTDHSIFKELYGVGGIVSSIGINGFGQYTYNATTLQSTYIMKEIDNNEIEYFEGYVPFVFPLDKDFVVSAFQFGGHGETVIQQVPAPNELAKGSIFYCTNTSKDPSNKVLLEAPMGYTVGGANTFTVNSGETVQFIGDKNSKDWMFIMSTKDNMTESEVQDIINKGNFISNVNVSNDDSSVTVNAKTIQFRAPFVVGNNGNVAEINLSDDLINVVDENNISYKTNTIKFNKSDINKGSLGIEITPKVPPAEPITIENEDASSRFKTNVIRFKGNGTSISHMQDGDVEVLIDNTPILSINDGINSVVGVSTINVSNMSISDIKDKELTLTASDIKFIDDNKREFSGNKIQSLDKSIRISNMGNGVVDVSKGKSDRNEGIHACLGNNQLVNSKYGKARLYFADTKVKGGQFVYKDINTKSFIIQDTDPTDDPNITGGTTFIIGLYYEPNSEVDNTLTQDGKIKLMLVDENDIELIDTNGNPMVVEKDYKAGDKVSSEIYFGEIQATASQEIHLKLECDFVNQEIISVGANTQICIQSITKDESGGTALDSFMLYTGYRLEVETKYYGYNSINLARSLIFPEPEVITDIGRIEFGEGLFLETKTPVKLSIQNNNLNISDDGSNLPIFSIVKYYDQLDSTFISGKNYKVTATLVDKDDAFRIDLLKYNGNGIPSVPCVESYSNENPVFTTDWVSVDSLFISEDAISGEHTQSKEFTIPDNSKALAIVMYPVERQLPINLQLKDFEGDITPWFNKVIIKNNSHISEMYTMDSKIHYTGTTYTPSGYSNYRYTANSSDTNVPIGVITGGDGKVINNNSWHDAGSIDPNKTQGDLLFKVDGKINMKYQARCFNEQSQINELYFWLGKVNGDGTFTKINDSVFNDVIQSNRNNPLFIQSKEFTFDVKANESYRMFMHSDKDDGFYLQSDTNGEPLFKIMIELNEVTLDQKHILDRLNQLDLETNEVVFMEDGKQVYNKVLQYDVKTGRMTVVDKVV